MGVYTGEYRHKVDSKKRVSLPSAIRKVIEQNASEEDSPKKQVNLWVTPDPEDERLLVFDGKDAFTSWVDQLFENLGGYNPGDKKKLALHTVLFARVKQIEADNSGRILLPADHREKVGINTELVITGNEDHFEIWDAQRWDNLLAEVDLASLMQ